MKTRSVVPNDAQAVHAWASDFKERYGVPPIAGGETPGGGAAVATPPAQPAAAPAQPAAPAAPAQPAAQPAAPAAGQPAAPAAPADPQAGQPAAPAEPIPDFAKTLLERMDELAPPAQVDPLAVELGFAPAPPQPLPGQPGFDPSQPGPAAGQPQPGGPQQPQPAALPGMGQPAVPGIPGAPQPGQSPDEFVEQLIDGRAAQVAERLLQERVAPLFQQQQAATRRTEGAALLEDYPELQDPTKQSALLQQAQAWGQEVLGTADVAREPGFLEVVHLAMKGLAAAKGQQPAATPGGGEVPIEGGGAASPTPAATDSEQIAQAIVNAKPGGGLDPLWR